MFLLAKDVGTSRARSQISSLTWFPNSCSVEMLQIVNSSSSWTSLVSVYCLRTNLCEYFISEVGQTNGGRKNVPNQRHEVPQPNRTLFKKSQMYLTYIHYVTGGVGKTQKISKRLKLSK